MHIVGLKYYSASDARKARALVAGASINFRQHYESAEHPDAYRAFCRTFFIGHMPRFASRVLVAAGGPSPVAATVTSVSGRGGGTQVIVDVASPLSMSPESCSLSRPAAQGIGVYAIVNVRNMKAYIGSTNNFETRRRQHLRELEQGSHFSPNLQREWRTDPGAFAFVVLDHAPEDLLEQEQHCKYIYHTEDLAVGYNQGSGFSPANQSRNQSPTQPSAVPRYARASSPGASWAAATYGTSGLSGGAGGTTPANPSTPSGNSKNSAAPQPTGCMSVLVIMALTVCLAIGMGVLRAADLGFSHPVTLLPM